MREGKPHTTLYLDGNVPVALVFANAIESQDYINDMAAIKAAAASFFGRFPEARTTQKLSVVAVKIGNEWLDLAGRMETKWVRQGLVPSVVSARKTFIARLIVA
jgi:hypothetical protein